MPANKTVPTKLSAKDFLNSISDTSLKDTSHQLAKVMTKASGKKPVMWGPSIIGFGTIHYKYESGREGDQPLIGFAPRKSGISIYGLRGALDALRLEPEDLGSCRAGKGCVSLKNLKAIDLTLLEKVLKKAALINSSSQG